MVALVAVVAEVAQRRPAIWKVIWKLAAAPGGKLAARVCGGKKWVKNNKRPEESYRM